MPWRLWIRSWVKSVCLKEIQTRRKQMNRGKRFLAGAVLFVGLIGAFLGTTRSASGSPVQPAAGDEVKIDNFTFAPGEITVAKGTTVKWVNRDDIPHTVV